MQQAHIRIGKPCKYGHGNLRYASGGRCVTCQSTSNSKWVAKNLEKKNAKTREWRANNRERAKTTNARWRAANPERISAQQATWRAANVEHRRAYNAAWISKNVESSKQYFAKWRKTPAGVRLKARKAHETKRATPAWTDFEQMAKFYDDAAKMAKAFDEPFHVDHIYPIKGKTVCGLNVPANLCVLPGIENIKKSNRVPERMLDWHSPMSPATFRKWHYAELAAAA